MAREIELLLASRERKVLFRASQRVYRNCSRDKSQFADNLCDHLDDGGIWNPCRLIVEVDKEEDMIENGYYLFLYVLNYGIEEMGQNSHCLEMLKDRATYIESRCVEKVHNPIPPFLTKGGYYGPYWTDIRLQAIKRDGEQCTNCGISRELHRARFDQDLHVHHIEPLREIGNYKEANQLENLETLCADCHHQIEN